jgi:hypothetical protein
MDVRAGYGEDCNPMRPETIGGKDRISVTIKNKASNASGIIYDFYYLSVDKILLLNLSYFIEHHLYTMWTL